MSNTLIMRAYKKYSNELYEFSVEDIPVLVDSDEFILLNRRNSPRLCSNEIFVGCKEFHVFDGDVVLADGVEYLIRYNHGFYATDVSGHNRYLYEFNDIKPVSTYRGTEFEGMFSVRAKILFKSGHAMFSLTDILCGTDDSMWINGIKHDVKTQDIQQFTGSIYAGKAVFFGDSIVHGRVSLHGGRVVAISEKGCFDLYRKEMLDGRYTRNIDRERTAILYG